jgi:hypothetical protein
MTYSLVDLDKYASASGEFNVAENETTNSYTQALYRDDELWDTVVNGAGASATWTQATGGVTMTVTNSGEYVIRQSKLSNQYLAAAPQIWDLTLIDMEPEAGVVKRYGYGSASTSAPYNTSLDGFFLETDDTQIYLKIYKGGTTIFSAAQSTWDDPMDGTGRSGVTLVPTAFNALYCEFLYLGGTEATFGFLIGGKKAVPVHTFKNSNVNNATFVNSPSQPLLYSIHRNSGTGASSTVQICSKVGSKGIQSDKIKVRPHRYEVSGTSGLATPTVGTIYAVMAFRLNTRHSIVGILKWRITAVSADTFVYTVRKNPTIGGTALDYSAVPNSGYDVGFGALAGGTTVTGGTIVGVDTEIEADREQIIDIDINNILLNAGQAIDGTFDEFVLCIENRSTNITTKHSMFIHTVGQ